MPNKQKFRKNRKLKNKMKGGQAEGAEPKVPPLPTENDTIPAAKATPVRQQTGSAKSDYGSLNMNYFIFGISAIGLMGIIWLFLSRSMIRHEYSEALSYSLVALAIFLSFFMVMFAGIKNFSAGNGIKNGFKYLFKVVLYCITSCLPAILIGTQLAFLIYICYKHASFLYSSANIPALFSTFNKLAAIMVLGQSYVWYKQVSKIVLGKNEDSNPALVPGFILAAIVGGIAISQMFIILEYLKTDC